MDPVCFYIGHKPIYWYGIFMAAAFLAGIVNWRLLAKRDGRDPALAGDLAFWAMIAGVVGARIAYVLSEWSYFSRNPQFIVRVDQGGLIFYGGFIGAALAVILLARRRHMPILEIGDFAILSLPLGHALGRIGCFVNGCCYGRPATVPWAVPHDGTPVHPVQLYEAAANLILFVALMLYYPHRRKAGRVSAFYLIAYAAMRWVLEWFRGDDRVAWAGLPVAQWISLLLFLSGVALFLTSRHANDRTAS